MKVLFFTAVWKRPEITEICFMGLRRIMSQMDAEALAVISEDSMIGLCNRYRIKYLMHENLPLGKKKNAGLSQAMKMDWDYLIELGSDDLLLNGCVEFYRTNFGKEYFGFNHVAYIDSETGQCRSYKTNTCFGLGRAIRRDVIETIAEGVEVLAHETIISPGRTTQKGNTGFFREKDASRMEAVGQVTITSATKYKLWSDEINRAMDNNSNYRIEVHGGIKRQVIECPEPMGVDIKSKDNIWPFNPSIGAPYDMEKLMEGLSNEEQGAICQMIKQRQWEKQVIR